MNRKKHIIRKQNFVKFKLVFAVKTYASVHTQRTMATIIWNSSPHANRDLRASPATQSPLHDQCICEV